MEGKVSSVNYQYSPYNRGRKKKRRNAAGIYERIENCSGIYQVQVDFSPRITANINLLRHLVLYAIIAQANMQT